MSYQTNWINYQIVCCHSYDVCANFFGTTAEERWHFHGFSRSFCSWVGAIFRFNFLRSAQASLLSPFNAYFSHCVPPFSFSPSILHEKIFFLLSPYFARKTSWSGKRALCDQAHHLLQPNAPCLMSIKCFICGWCSDALKQWYTSLSVLQISWCHCCTEVQKYLDVGICIKDLNWNVWLSFTSILVVHTWLPQCGCCLVSFDLLCLSIHISLVRCNASMQKSG